VAWYSLADTPIGLSPSVPRRTRRAAAAIGLALLAVDLTGTRLGWWRDIIVLRLVPPAIAAILLMLLGARREQLGLRWPPLPSLRFWLRGVAVLVGGLAVLLLVALAVAARLNLRIVPFPPGYHRALDAIVLAPVFEETIWRFAMLPALVSAVGPRWAIVIDGAGLAALHFVYGMAAPDNFVGGYFFAWVFLRSGSIALPLALHIGANAFAIVGQLVAWQLLH
jgi:membrane protease YdiL (CAAX protease family)